MIRVVVEVWQGATSFRVVAQAKNLREAVSIAAAMYPNTEVRVRFPIDAEAFFVRDPTARVKLASLERAEGMVA
jgi:hypothetical protein